MCSTARRPKSAIWIRDQDSDIYHSPVGTFDRAAAPRWEPTSSFGTSARFRSKQTFDQFQRERAGKGPGYDVLESYPATEPAVHGGNPYRPSVGKPITEPAPISGRPIEFESGGRAMAQGSGVLYAADSQFAKAAALRSSGQGPLTGATSQMGTSARFEALSGTPRWGGLGSQKHKASTIGCPLTDIRSWPPMLSEVERGPAVRLHFTQGHKYGGRGGHGGEGADQFYDIPSCFDRAAFKPLQASSCMGTADKTSIFRGPYRGLGGRILD